jgi:hypothetical protein
MGKSKDPAFLFYPGSASEETQFMNRLERGAYFDLLKAQKKFRKFSLILIRKVLGGDFEVCWPAIESVLEKEGDLYFIGWVEDAITARAAHSEKQKKKIQEYWDKKKKKDSTVLPESFHGINPELPLINENVIENINAITNEVKELKEEVAKIESSGFAYELDDVTFWTDQVIKGNDETFTVMARNNSLDLNGSLERLARDHLTLCGRYEWHKNMTTQQAFRISLIGHLAKELKTDNPKRPTKKLTIEDLNQ